MQSGSDSGSFLEEFLVELEVEAREVLAAVVGGRWGAVGGLELDVCCLPWLLVRVRVATDVDAAVVGSGTDGVAEGAAILREEVSDALSSSSSFWN